MDKNYEWRIYLGFFFSLSFFPLDCDPDFNATKLPPAADLGNIDKENRTPARK